MVAAQASAALTTWRTKIIREETVRLTAVTYILLWVLVGLQHLQNYQLGEGVETSDQRILFQHLGQNSEDERSAGALTVLEVLQEDSEESSEVLQDAVGVAAPDDPDDGGHGLPPVRARLARLDCLECRHQVSDVGLPGLGV